MGRNSLRERILTPFPQAPLTVRMTGREKNAPPSSGGVERVLLPGGEVATFPSITRRGSGRGAGADVGQTGRRRDDRGVGLPDVQPGCQHFKAEGGGKYAPDSIQAPLSTIFGASLSHRVANAVMGAEAK